jgi:hypothetical protein
MCGCIEQSPLKRDSRCRWHELRNGCSFRQEAKRLVAQIFTLWAGHEECLGSSGPCLPDLQPMVDTPEHNVRC